MAGKNLLSAIFAIGLLFMSFKNADAVTIPDFSSCANPQGSLKVSYSQGTHGVPGSANSYTGSDSVYTLSDNTLVQCLCADNGQGTQTNWWKVSSLTAEEVAVLVSQGWTQIPDGSA